MTEQRRFTRIRFRGPATLAWSGSSHHVDVLDLSLKGALLHFNGAAPVPVGGRCRIEVPLDDRAAVIRMEGDIRHIEGNRAGLHCDTIDIDSITHLRRLVELNLADPNLLDRELRALWETRGD